MGIKPDLTKIIFSFCGLAGLFFSAGRSGCSAADWRQLHDLADKISLNSALEDSLKDPGSREKAYVLGLVYLNLWKNREAEELFSRLSVSGEKSIPVKWAQAELLRRKHSTDESGKVLKEIISSQPDFFPAQLSLAYLKYSKRDFKGALELASRVFSRVSRDDDQADYSRSCLIIAGAKGMIANFGGPISKLVHGTQVRAYLDRASRIRPESADVLFGFGCYYLLLPDFLGKDPEKAKELLERAISAVPLFADAYVRLAQVYKLKGDDPKYSELLDKALEIDPGNEIALDVKSGQCHFICSK